MIFEVKISGYGCALHVCQDLEKLSRCYDVGGVTGGSGLQIVVWIKMGMVLS